MIEKDSVKREIVIHAKAAEVWKALTNPEELNRWYTKECEIDLRIGGRLRMVHGWGAWTEGVITELIEGEKLVFRTEDECETVIAIEEEEDGVRVSIEYRMLFMGDEGIAMSENMAFGTYQFLQNARSVLETGTDLRPFFWPTWIGLSHTSVRPDHELNGVRGTLVLRATEGSPSEASGILPGDIVVEANRRAISRYEDLETAVWTVKPGEKLILKVLRDGKERQLTCLTVPHPRAEKVV